MTVAAAVEDQLAEVVRQLKSSYFGKYRGIVDSVGTGAKLGMISVKVPQVWPDERVIDDVRPCAPFAGKDHGLMAIPESGDHVWIEFEAGNTEYPIWTGFWWGDGEMPEPKDPLIRSFITTKGHKLLLDDKDNKVTLLHADKAEMTMTNGDVTIKIGDATIEMKSDKITLKVGPTAKLEIKSTEIAIETSAVGSVKLTTSGVELANGAMKLGA